MDTATKTAITSAETASKRTVQNTEEARGDLIGNEIADKITSAGKTKSKEKEDETNKIQEIYIPTEEKQKIIDDIRYQTIINLLNTTSDNAPKFITRKWIEVHGLSGNADNRYKPSKPRRF